MASAQEKATACCLPARDAAGARRAIAVAGKVSMAGGGERVVSAAGGGAVMEDIGAAVQPTTAKASSKGIPIMTRAQTFHPLDPLSAAEIAVAVATVRAAGKSPEERDSMRFVEAVLLEPEKNVVALADAYFFPPFQPSLLPRTKGSPVIPSRLPPRRAKLVVYNRRSNETTIWIVELSEVHAATRGGHHRGKVISSEVIPDVQPAMDAMEYAECEATVKNYPPFIEAMKKRGVDDMELVMVDAWCAGYYSEADAPSRRLARPLIFCLTESDSPMENGYARPVEGIHVVVDMQNSVVIEFEDRKFVPLPPPDHLRNYTPGETRGGVDRSDLKPLIIDQPEGPSFRINGYFVEWQKWNFRIGFTPKEGLVIYSVAYVDGSRGRRPIAHRLSFVEMVVPYGDPSEPHYRKNAFDAGEDGLGKNAHSLKKGCDCLGYIKYFDAHFTNFTGHVETIENCVCLHEEDHGILWKHQDWRTGLAEVRRSRRLTVSFICTVANYEYGFYWHFYQDGKIEAEIKLTGILSLGALMPGETRKYGTTIAPSLYAPVHQHFFIARMDMAVDCKPNEAHNQVVEVNVKIENAGTHNVHNNAFYAEEKILKSELQAMRDCDPSSARLPALPYLFSGGRAAWDEVGRVGRRVQSSLGLFLGEMPVFGYMPVEVRALDLKGQIWRCLGVLLLVTVLWWLEPTTVERSFIVDSINKALVRGDGLGGRAGIVRLLLPRRHGAETEELVDIVVDDPSYSQGKSKLLSGDQHMVDLACHRDLWLVRRPLQAPCTAFLQPPVRRPFAGFLPAFPALAAPSGRVPGGGDGGRQWSPYLGGGAKGPDCFFGHLCRVLSAYFEDCCVIFFFL